jgi:hypothetical protein
MNGQQKDAPFRGAAKAGLKEMDQRHMNLAQGNGFNFQRGSLVHNNQQLAIGNWQKPLSCRFSQISGDGNLAANAHESTRITSVSGLSPAIMQFMAVSVFWA